MIRFLIGLALFAGCDRNAPNEAPQQARAARAAGSLASAPATAASASAPGAAPAPPVLTGRLLEIRTGKEPAVVLDTGGDRVTVRGVDAKALPWKQDDQLRVAGTAPRDGVLDCSEPHRCSVGLAKGGNVVLRDANAFASLHLLKKLQANVFLVGPSRQASVQLRAESPQALVQGLAAAFGLSTKRRGNVTLMAPRATLASLQVPALGLANTPVDLHLVGASLANVTRLMTSVTQSSLSGEVRGEISLIGRELGASDTLSTCLALCGVKHRRKGKQIVVLEQDDTCTAHPLPEPRCPQPKERLERALEARLACVDPTQLRVLAVALLPGHKPVAVLGSGGPRGDEIAVREGDFLAQSEIVRIAASELELNWKVAAITREHVELLLADPQTPKVKEKRLRISVR